MKYCSECGAPVVLGLPPGDARQRHICEACGRIHYANPHIIVSCAVSVGERVLMSRRAIEPARGQWILPSGYLECGETLEHCAARETFEETGVVVDPEALDLNLVMNLVHINQVVVGFRIALAHVPALRAGPESLEVAFLTEAEIPKKDFAWRSVMGDAPLQFYRELRSGRFSVRLVTPQADHDTLLFVREYRIESIQRQRAGSKP